MKTSASATRRYSTACPSGLERSSARLFLLRDSSIHAKLCGLAGYPGKLARWREGSPVTGGSILITSAPKSDSTVAAAGAAMKLAQSRTLRPSKMPFSIVAIAPRDLVGFVRVLNYRLQDQALFDRCWGMMQPPFLRHCERKRSNP